MKRKIALVILAVGLAAAAGWAQQESGPLNEKEVIKLLKKNKKDQMKAAAIVGERGVSFDVTEEFQKELAKAGAEEVFYRAVIGASPSGRSFSTPLGEKLAVSHDEKADILLIQSELDPERQIQLATDFEKKHPQSPVLTYVLSHLAGVYQARGDLPKTIDYAERSVESDPRNVAGLVTLAVTLAQPRMLQATPAENQKQAARAESYATQALELLQAVPSTTLETDEILQKRVSAFAADAHTALGLVALFRDEFPKAVDEFKSAITTSSGANSTNYFRLGEAYESMGRLDQAIDAFQTASDLSPGSPFQSFAEKKISEIKARRALIGR